MVTTHPNGLYLVDEEIRVPTFVLIEGRDVWPIQMRSPALDFNPAAHRLRRVDLGAVLAREPEEVG